MYTHSKRNTNQTNTSHPNLSRRVLRPQSLTTRLTSPTPNQSKTRNLLRLITRPLNQKSQPISKQLSPSKNSNHTKHDRKRHAKNRNPHRKLLPKKRTTNSHNHYSKQHKKSTTYLNSTIYNTSKFLKAKKAHTLRQPRPSTNSKKSSIKPKLSYNQPSNKHLSTSTIRQPSLITTNRKLRSQTTSTPSKPSNLRYKRSTRTLSSTRQMSTTTLPKRQANNQPLRNQ